MSIYGIDVSSYNGAIDWERVKEAGVRHAVIKINRKDLSPDSRFFANWEGCTKAGIPCGVYRYVYEATPKQAEKAAKSVVELLGKARAPKGTMVWWDVEDHSIQPVLQKEKETLRQSILTARRIAEDAGYGFGVYTGLWWYHAVLNTENLDCPFWIARYPSRKAMAFGTAPDPKYRPEIRHRLWGWQYSSAGQVPGIHHSTDLDVIYTRSESVPQYREPTKNLRLGSRGDGVHWVQQRLNAHGASLQVDGIFGKQTDAAVRAFQSSHNLDADGIVGPKTREKLRK